MKISRSNRRGVTHHSSRRSTTCKKMHVQNYGSGRHRKIIGRREHDSHRTRSRSQRYASFCAIDRWTLRRLATIWIRCRRRCLVFVLRQREDDSPCKDWQGSWEICLGRMGKSGRLIQYRCRRFTELAQNKYCPLARSPTRSRRPAQRQLRRNNRTLAATQRDGTSDF